MDCRLRRWDARAAKKDGKKMTLIDIIILLRSKLTHSEFQFSNRYYGISFSFTSADGANGARFKAIDYNKHPNRWVTDVIPMTDEQEDLAFQEACRMADIDNTIIWPHKTIFQGKNHQKYDYAGLLSHALKKSDHWWLNIVRFGLWSWTAFVKPDPDKAWCSEGCAYLIMTDHKILDKFCNRVPPDTLDPQELHELVKRLGQGQVMNHTPERFRLKESEEK